MAILIIYLPPIYNRPKATIAFYPINQHIFKGVKACCYTAHCCVGSMCHAAAADGGCGGWHINASTRQGRQRSTRCDVSQLSIRFCQLPRDACQSRSHAILAVTAEPYWRQGSSRTRPQTHADRQTDTCGMITSHPVPSHLWSLLNPPETQTHAH